MFAPTANTTMTSIDLNTPSDDGRSRLDLLTSSQLVTQSAPNTPLAHHRHQPGARHLNDANGNQSAATSSGGSSPTLDGSYKAGIASLTDGIFACFKPVWGYFGKSATDIRSKQLGDAWEIPFESITDLNWLGSGSQGAVFSGRLNNEMIAVKKVGNKDETNIQHLRHLNHKNVVRFLGVCTSEISCYCIVMEYCSEGVLSEILKKTAPLGYQQWLDWNTQIASGMAYLHKNKVIHRDLKSPNILRHADNTLKICDFGTSHQQNKMHSTIMSFCGTVSWMAPEMIKKEKCSEKVDVYSFGVVLWEMLTREQPYKDIDSMAIIFGVGSNKLSLPIPSSAPDGLKMLLKQCWSWKPINRPSFNNVLQHLEIAKKELSEMGDSEWKRRMDEWKREAICIDYPETVKGQNGEFDLAREEEEMKRKRAEALRHAMDIREMYQAKLNRASKMYAKLKLGIDDLNVWKQELAEREARVYQMEVHLGMKPPPPHTRLRPSEPRPLVVRAGPNAIRGHQQDVYCTSIPHPSYYGGCAYPAYPGGGYAGAGPAGAGHVYECASSSDDEHMAEFARGSPYRFSAASSSSGFPSSQSQCFSRQSSARSSAGPRKGESPMNQPFSRDVTHRHSHSLSQYDLLMRNSPARRSGMSDDSGVQHMEWPAGSSQMLPNVGNCLPQTIYRHQDGRWSDGRLGQKRRPRRSTSTAFQRDSPQRVPARHHKEKRCSYPSRADDHGCSAGCMVAEAATRAQRARSMVVDRSECSCLDLSLPPLPPKGDHADSPCRETTEEPECSIPFSTSYQEALRLSAADLRYPQHVEVTRDKQRGAVPIVGYTNPLYSSPISTFTNPLLETGESMENSLEMGNSLDVEEGKRQAAEDASGESSEDEHNGNTLDSSLDSRAAFARLHDTASADDESAEAAAEAKRRREHLLLLTSTTTMDSSLERSLEMAAIHSDGLSDKEMQVRAMRHSVRGHRRTHSNPQQTMMVIMDESSTSSDEQDAVRC